VRVCVCVCVCVCVYVCVCVWETEREREREVLEKDKVQRLLDSSSSAQLVSGVCMCV